MSSFFHEVKRRKVYRVAVAYTVGGGIIQLASAAFPAWELPDWALRLVIVLLLIGFPIALILACAFDVTPKLCSRNTVRKLSVAILAFWCSAAAQAEWRVFSSEKIATAPAGVVHVETRAEDDQNDGRATLHLAIFSMKTATLRVIDDPAERHASLAETMQREHCIAGVNGGYFDPDYAPVGLLISDARVVAPLRKARLLSGVLTVVNGRVQIQRPTEFSAKTKPVAARQSGPFLVNAGKPIAGLNDTRPARRTFVATGDADRVAIGYCSYVTLAQLGTLLATSGVAPEFKIQRALNLDGGSSSGFWFMGENGPFSISEQKGVRDYLAIVPK